MAEGGAEPMRRRVYPSASTVPAPFTGLLAGTAGAALSVLLGCGDSAGREVPARARAGSPATPAATPGTIGPIGANGGIAARLLFACVGDTRPPTEDDTSAYPASVITQIFASIQALEPQPAFAIATGDYVFASNRPDTQAAPQLDIYLEARARFQGAFFPAMGNHECTGATTSNCGSGAQDGVTANYAAFMQKLLAPVQKSEPYYVIRVDAGDRGWSAKFVFVAANAWSIAQENWLEAALSQATTYTFIVRHEPATAVTAPGVAPSEAIMARHPYTLAIVGHSHTYRHPASNWREVLIGNGGAPLTSKDYGFGLFAQRSDGAVVVDMVQWRTGQTDPDFHFVVEPDGTPAP
jgi:Calcineurin-like phosphoesterase